MFQLLTAKFMLRALAATAVLLGAVAAQPQTIDPRMLEQLQSQLGARQSASESAPPPALSQTPKDDAGGTLLPGGRVDTTEEQEVRRARARQELRTLYEPTRVEQEFRRRLEDDSLRQFGYSFFQSAPAPTGVRTGAIGDAYVLGIGDALQVSFRGSVNSSNRAVVDRDGMIVVGTLRPIRAAGRSLGTVRAEITAETQRTMLATDVFVSVGDVRSISVFVGGEVERPGQYSLTSLADIGTAVAQAGGIRRSGSLRQVRVVRAGGGTVVADLYGLLGIGAPPAIRIQDGDRIIVPVIGTTVAVTGDVPRPGIYELRGRASLGAVLDFAGGPIRTSGSDVVISRISASGEDVVVQTKSTATTVMAGDAIMVRGSQLGSVSGRVMLAGHVASPGPRALGEAPTVAALLGSPDRLFPSTYRLLAMLVRRDMQTGARDFIAIDLLREFDPFRTTRLQGDDLLILFSQTDIEELAEAERRGDASEALFDAQGRPIAERPERLPARPRGTNGTNGTNGPSETGADGADRETADRMRGADDATDPLMPIFEQYPELLPVLRERIVLVAGAVRRPGAYPIAGPVSVDAMVRAAEGIAVDAVDPVVEIVRATPGPVERTSLAGGMGAMASLLVNPGDRLAFLSARREFAAGTVTIEGEVNRPGTYNIRQGEKLSDLLARAGGLAPEAYAYGAVFTRQSVQQAQQEGFRRTAREMYNGLFAVMARTSEGQNNDVAGAVALIGALASVEAPGRVVVEADPRVLALRPDLDIALERGDRLFIPRRPNYVLALGDVLNPGALQFVDGKEVARYVGEAGGTMSTADRGRMFVVLPNGTAQPVSLGGWGGGNFMPPPGTTIIVPKNIDPLFKLGVIRDITTIVAQLATSVATVAILSTR